ncbi:MAG: sugar kinase [Pseudomonadota bacterium]
MTVLSFGSNRTVAIGEAMIEMAVVGEGTYKRGFAGDTFNTAWHMAQLLGPDFPLGFATKVGSDTISDNFTQGLSADGMDMACVARDANRTMGLYMIELDGAERHFHYWRKLSAARLLADDAAWLDHVTRGAGLIHVSGITLAILPPDGRARLWEALAQARLRGARVSFDPNVRPRLWSSTTETRDTLARFFEITDIALPSFDDEAALWGDASPDATLDRFAQAGVTEIAIKNGAGAVLACSDGAEISVPTPPVSDIRDTSGAGDAFNAGYLAARLSGMDQPDAIACGQRISSQVICHFGARLPKEHMPKFR